MDVEIPTKHHEVALVREAAEVVRRVVVQISMLAPSHSVRVLAISIRETRAKTDQYRRAMAKRGYEEVAVVVHRPFVGYF